MQRDSTVGGEPGLIEDIQIASAQATSHGPLAPSPASASQTHRYVRRRERRRRRSALSRRRSGRRRVWAHSPATPRGPYDRIDTGLDLNASWHGATYIGTGCVIAQRSGSTLCLLASPLPANQPALLAPWQPCQTSPRPYSQPPP
eukprot:scaffold73117_cov62-Phaeocystis_antarctica.AAC.1